jgi:hypothetical protein
VNGYKIKCDIIDRSVIPSTRYTVMKRSPHLRSKSRSVSCFAYIRDAYVDVPKVVPYASAVPGARNAPAIGIQQNHTEMVKFGSRKLKAYQDVSLHVKRMVGKAPKQVEVNWANWTLSMGV